MRNYFLIIILIFIASLLLLAGCVPSEETGGSNRSRNPIQISGRIDTTRRSVNRAMRQDTVLGGRADSSKIVSAKKPKVAPRFKSRQDTVRASIVTRTKLSSQALIKIIRPEHPVYTVQVGAFGQISNALRAQKKAKEHFLSQPVFNTFIKQAKIYRVSIGRYEDRKDAFALIDSLKRQHPGEYKQCWINFIP